jgi:hypothetical protein
LCYQFQLQWHQRMKIKYQNTLMRLLTRRKRGK